MTMLRPLTAVFLTGQDISFEFQMLSKILNLVVATGFGYALAEELMDNTTALKIILSTKNIYNKKLRDN